MRLAEVPVVRDQIKKCVRCGQCRAVCPVFRELRTEGSSPRSQVFAVQKLRDGELPPSLELAEKLANCLLCEACSLECPSGIKVHELVMAARAELASCQSAFKRRLLRSIWTSPAGLGGWGRLLWLMQRTGLDAIARATGLTRALAGDLAPAGRMLGRVPRRSALSSLGGLTGPRSTWNREQHLRVAYFVGCASNVFFPEIVLDAVDVLTRNGCAVVINEKLSCCGLPQVANGERDIYEHLVVDNIQKLKAMDIDYIVTDCASCSSELRRYGEVMIGTDSAEDAGKISARVRDLSVFLVDVLGIESVSSLGSLPECTVTYHDPCHLARCQGITAQPRILLRAVPGVSFKEMNSALDCCGGGGTFSFSHYGLAGRILDRKVAAVKASGAGALATCCPACAMQLRHGLQREGLKLEVLHPVQLLARAYRQVEARRKDA